MSYPISRFKRKFVTGIRVLMFILVSVTDVYISIAML